MPFFVYLMPFFVYHMPFFVYLMPFFVYHMPLFCIICPFSVSSAVFLLFCRIPQVHQELKFPDLGGKLALTGAAYSLSVGPLGGFVGSAVWEVRWVGPLNRFVG